MATPPESLLEWDEEAVNKWLAIIGFSHYKEQIIEHGISGEILSLLDHDGLKEIGIHSVGQRLAILKEVYYLKVAYNIPIEPEHYVPPSEAVGGTSQGGLSIDHLHDLIQQLGDRTRVLEEDNRRLAESLNYVMDQIPAAKSADKISLPSTSNDSHPSPRNRPLTDATLVESPQHSPRRPEHDASPTHPTYAPRNPRTTPAPTPIDRSMTQNPINPFSQSLSSSSTARPARDAKEIPATTPGGSAPADNQFKSFKVSLEDPCWKVLPAALKKYKINDDWRKYVMFICYGSTERCLSYDEKPLLLFQKLKDANKNPVFMLRHIKDIRSPISVAQQKKSLRQRDGGPSPSTPGPASSRPGTSSNTPQTPGGLYSRNTRLHQPPVLHPISAQAQAFKNAEGTSGGGPQGLEGSSEEPSPHPNIKDSLAAAGNGNGGASYAIAIYPYTADQDDEFDVAVDDTFIIRSREKGWWVVQRDILGLGNVASSPTSDDALRWVPAGCLLETIMPPAQAIQDTRMVVSSSGSSSSSPVSPSSKHPILPPHIVSTSFPGVTLMNYGDKGEHELTLTRGDVLRVFKRYNHWSYAIKEETGERGWVPSWFIGKYTPGSAAPATLVPPTPTSSSMPTTSNSGEGGQTPGDAPTSNGSAVATQAGAVNGSPMSQAFPGGQAAQSAYLRNAVAPI